MTLWLNILAGLGTMASVVLTFGLGLVLAVGVLFGAVWLSVTLSDYLRPRPRITLTIKAVLLVVFVTVLAAAVGEYNHGRIVTPQEIFK